MVMQHSDIASKHDLDPGQGPEHPGLPPREVRRERIPTFVDQLDCLLTVWVAEATLDSEREARLDRCDAPGGPPLPRSRVTGRTGTAAWSRA
jgi:hypothetical protein